ncbi:MAG TPA: hypothetical protein VII16_08510 [Actinomycetes bacterium]|jgi:hypothetical protein
MSDRTIPDPAPPISPSALVAYRQLRALRITDAASAAQVLAWWVRPTPRLSVTDVTDILAAYDAVALTGDDELREAKPPTPRTGNDTATGFPVGGPPGRRAERPDDE